MQLFFLDLCFTALVLEEPTPLGFLPFFVFGGVEDATRLCRFGFLLGGELDLVVYGGEVCWKPLLGFLVVAEIVLGSLGGGRSQVSFRYQLICSNVSFWSRQRCHS